MSLFGVSSFGTNPPHGAELSIPFAVAHGRPSFFASACKYRLVRSLCRIKNKVFVVLLFSFVVVGMYDYAKESN